jgi:hypothetical protein
MRPAQFTAGRVFILGEASVAYGRCSRKKLNVCSHRLLGSRSPSCASLIMFSATILLRASLRSSRRECRTRHLECDPHDALGLGVEAMAVQEWGDGHGVCALRSDHRRERDWSLSHRAPWLTLGPLPVMDEVYALIQPKSHNINYWGGIAAGNIPQRGRCAPRAARNISEMRRAGRNQMEALELASWPQMEKGRQSVMSTFEPRFGGAHFLGGGVPGFRRGGAVCLRCEDGDLLTCSEHPSSPGTPREPAQVFLRAHGSVCGISDRRER